MSTETSVLLITAASIGFSHTLIGPDHYLPFVVLGRSKNWSIVKTIWITVLCGVGHVASSILVGFVGIALGIGVGKLEVFEMSRGSIASWSLMILGLIYLVWGIYKAKSGKPHKHIHMHADGTVHQHEGSGFDKKEKRMTPWVLFTIFVLGPCEPLIPILMYPAAKNNLASAASVSLVFAFTTVITMSAVVFALLKGVSLISLGRIEKYTHAIAGGTIFISGAGIVFFGL